MAGTAALPPLPVDSDMETVTLMRSVQDHLCVETTTVKQGTTGWTAVKRGNCANQRMTGTAAPRSVRSNYISCCVKLTAPQDAPCDVGEGDCDNDDECQGEHTCGDNNCEDGDSRMDCCV